MGYPEQFEVGCDFLFLSLPIPLSSVYNHLTTLEASAWKKRTSVLLKPKLPLSVPNENSTLTVILHEHFYGVPYNNRKRMRFSFTCSMFGYWGSNQYLKKQLTEKRIRLKLQSWNFFPCYTKNTERRSTDDALQISFQLLCFSLQRTSLYFPPLV